MSGGKDSTAVYLLALERSQSRGIPFRAVCADTGHEHPLTYEYIRTLHERTGGPEVEFYKADFTKKLAQKRNTVQTKWRREGVPEAQIERALEVLQPTGNPFVDLCLWKGRFPSSQIRFCTEHLKSRVIEEKVTLPALEQGNIARWQGERRDESRKRSQLPKFQKVRWTSPTRTILIHRPIVHWTVDDVFAQHDKHGVKPNPLYRQGMGRVGCMPCIMARKSEIRQIGQRFPGEIDRVAEWEELVADASKRGASTFFAADKTHEGRELLKSGATTGFPDIHGVVAWANTDRKGEPLDDPDEGLSCSSEYGLCE